MAHQVFISYSKNDKQTADEICSALESNGIQCWIAPRDILPGMDWGSSIIDAISTSSVMIIVLSENSNTSPQVRREVERAVNKDITIIPFRIDNVILSKSLEYHLSSTHWLDASTPPMERHLQTLAEKVAQILKVPVEKKNFVPVPPPPVPNNWTLIVAGLIIGLILFTGLVWLLVRANQSPENKMVGQNQFTPTPKIEENKGATTPKSEENKVVPNQNQNNTSQSTPVTQTPVPPITEKTYDEARKLLIDAGWQPRKNRWTYEKDENIQTGNGPTFWKKGYWEVVSCAGTGTAECRFEFIDANGRTLVVITAGEEDDEGGKYHATVLSYTFKKKKNNDGK
jgi:TIR domain